MALTVVFRQPRGKMFRCSHEDRPAKDYGYSSRVPRRRFSLVDDNCMMRWSLTSSSLMLSRSDSLPQGLALTLN